MRQAEPPCLTKARDPTIVARDWMSVTVILKIIVFEFFFSISAEWELVRYIY
ncbi:hypothetical protein [Vibrio jasicida]|uniref:hypothetical protein n=1 Tax=Vibrio jasicida TaxID=766224 RepID=UPI0012D39D81|nr:hypothetical protein [Vibrio jasicida]